MLTNLLRVVTLPQLHVARVDMTGRQPYKGIFYDTGVFHCFKYGNIYFWGDPTEVIKVCEGEGWEYWAKESCTLELEQPLFEWNVLSVLLGRALNSFLYQRGFIVRPADAFIREQPKGEPTQLVYRKYGRQVHEGFSKSFINLDYQIYLALVPKIVLTRTIDGRSQTLSHEEAVGIYTKLYAPRRAGQEKELLKTWARILSSEHEVISIPVSGDRNGLVINSQYEVLSE